MLISKIVQSITGTLPIFRDGAVCLSPSLLQGDAIGPRVAERLARVASSASTERYFDAPRGGLVYVDSTTITYLFTGTHWRATTSVRADSEALVAGGWRRVAGEAGGDGEFVRATLFAPHPRCRVLPCFWGAVMVADVEVSDDLGSMIAEDARERAERVVWRPRSNQFVVRIAGGVGTILRPDGREILFMATDAAIAALCVAVGVPRSGLAVALIEDPVWGRSEYRRRGDSYDRYTGGFSPETFTRVVGFGVVRRIRAAEVFRTRSESERETIDGAIAAGAYITCRGVLGGAS